MKRDLIRGNGDVLGSVSHDVETGGQFDGAAVEVFRSLAEREGPDAAAAMLVDQGWSNGNGSIYLDQPA